MAKKSEPGTAQADTVNADIDMSPGDKTVYYNEGQAVSPRGHQPAVPEEAKRANEAAQERAKAKTLSDVDAVSPPGMVSEPKEKSAKADDVNAKVSKQNLENK